MVILNTFDLFTNGHKGNCKSDNSCSKPELKPTHAIKLLPEAQVDTVWNIRQSKIHVKGYNRSNPTSATVWAMGKARHLSDHSCLQFGNCLVAITDYKLWEALILSLLAIAGINSIASPVRAVTCRCRHISVHIYTCCYHYWCPLHGKVCNVDCIIIRKHTIEFYVFSLIDF